MKKDVFQDLVIAPNDGGQERWRWLYGEIRAAILSGRLRAGSRLPASRSLALQYKLARGTVVMAYKQLRLEGYIDVVVNSGTFVAGLAFVATGGQTGDPIASTSRGAKASVETSNREFARQIPIRRIHLPSLPRDPLHIPTRAQLSLEGTQVLPGITQIGKAFRFSESAIDLFPVKLWARVASRVYRKAPRWLYGRGSPVGYLPLRKAIAQYLGSARGVRCSHEQIVVTSGAQQALYLIARLLLEPTDAVWIEDPGYPGAYSVFQAVGASIIPVPVDAEGIDVKAGKRLAPRAKLAYVTPANQFPLGTTMSASRRVELLKWARETGSWVIDDDYDSEYRYSGRPVASLQSTDSSGSVIYVGTFTKMLFNSLRIGFMVLPTELVPVFEAARSFVDRYPPTLDQAILAEFITEGHFGHHIQKMRRAYAHRQDVLVEACTETIGKSLTMSKSETGLKAIGWLPPNYSDVKFAKRAEALGLEVTAVSHFSVTTKLSPGLILGFGGCNEAELHRGARVLAQAFSSS